MFMYELRTMPDAAEGVSRASIVSITSTWRLSIIGIGIDVEEPEKMENGQFDLKFKRA